MANKLQQALSKVKTLKIPVERIEGGTYQAQQQTAQKVNQTNYAGQLTGLMKLGTEEYGKFVDRQWTQAEQDFADASSKPEFDELKWLETKAEEEAQGFFGTLKAGFNELVGHDPNEYRKAVAMYKDSERQMFEIDKEIEAKEKLGQYVNLEEALKERDEKRGSAMKALATTYGVPEDNSYITKGMSRNNEASLKALATTQALSTETQLAAKGAMNLTSEFNGLVAQKVGNVALYQAKFDKAIKDGTIRGTEAQQRFIKDTFDNFTKAGNVHMAMAWLEQPQASLDGKALADVLPEAVVIDSIGKAEEVMWSQNQELASEFNSRSTSIQVTTETDPAKALKQLDEMQNWLEKSQPSNYSTVQAQALQTLRSNIVLKTERLNQEREVRIKKEREQAAQVQSAIIDTRTRMSGGIASLEQYDKETMSLAHKSMYDTIMADESLKDIQKAEQVVNLLSEVPDDSALRSAILETAQKDINTIDSAIVNAGNNIISENMPESFERQMKLYTANPEVYGKMVDSETLAKMQVHHAGIENLGFTGYTKAMSKAHLLTKEEKSANTVLFADASKKHNLSATESKVAEMYGQLYLGTGSSAEEAAKKGTKDYMKTQQVFGDSGEHRLSNSTLAPFGNKQEVPVILDAINVKLAQWKAASPNAVFTVSDDQFGNVYIEDATTGTVVKTKAETIWNNYIAIHGKKGESNEEALDRMIDEKTAQGEATQSWLGSPYNHKTYKQANPW